MNSQPNNRPQDLLVAASQSLRTAGADEDDLQDAVVEVIPQIDHIRNVAAYLARATFHKRLRRQRRLEFYQGRHRRGRRTRTESAGTSLIDRLQERETIDALWQAVTRLPPRERLVAEFHLRDEMDCTSIAERLGWSLGAVRNLWFRARRRLRRSLGMSDG